LLSQANVLAFLFQSLFIYLVFLCPAAKKHNETTVRRQKEKKKQFQNSHNEVETKNGGLAKWVVKAILKAFAK